jgi:hypothetical protein
VPSAHGRFLRGRVSHPFALDASLDPLSQRPRFRRLRLPYRGDAPDAGARERCIELLTADVPGLDIVPLVGASPWRRLRTGNWRILLRPLTEDEIRRFHRTGGGYLIARVVDRRDLERAVRSL